MVAKEVQKAALKNYIRNDVKLWNLPILPLGSTQYILT